MEGNRAVGGLLFEYKINHVTKIVPFIILEIEIAHHMPLTPKK